MKTPTTPQGLPPVGTELYASAPPSPASVQNASLVEKLAKRTCEANADSARFTIALQTLRASLDPDDWMGAVTMHNYIDAVLAGGSPLQQHPAPSPAQATPVCGAQNAESYPQAPLSLTAAPQEWSPAYTRGPARQSAPVTAVPALVPLSVLQYNQIPELCQIRPSLYESVVRAIEAAIAKINGLTVGDGAQPIKDTP